MEFLLLASVMDWVDDTTRRIIALVAEVNTHFPIGRILTGFAVGCGGLFALWRSWQWVQRFTKAQAAVQRIRAAGFYSELDRFYAELLTLAVEHPHLRRVHRIATDAEVEAADYDPYPNLADGPEKERLCAAYDSYAFMVWNFLETIHDRCDEFPDDLLGTWATIVAAENRVHRGWFLQQLRIEADRRRLPDHEPSDKFCVEFQVFVVDKNFVPELGPDRQPILDKDGKPKYPNWSYAGRGAFKKTFNFNFSHPPSPRATLPPLLDLTRQNQPIGAGDVDVAAGG